VRTTLFPERVPGVRQRLTGGVALSQYLGHGIAVHLRNGVYADDWSVLAWVPEAAVAWAPLPRAVFDMHARWYSQTSARFYAPDYDDLAPELTADVRLGRLEERAVGVHADVQIVAQSSGIGALYGNGGYDLSVLRYRELARDVRGHLLTLGLRWLP
jgi:hypothetical protein